MEISDKISQIYNRKNVFITGATSFMGQVFIERLLRTSNVNKIFILIRSKHNKSSEERLTDILNDPLFEKIRKRMNIEMILKKIHIIEGDCAHKYLLLSARNRQLITENVSMIYHFAETARFNERFKPAVELNVRGLHELMMLAKACEKIELFCHISTGFCNMGEKVVLEKIYAHPADPFEVIEIVENHFENEAEEILLKYLDEETIPNSYCFTKSLAEKLIDKMNETLKLPMLICRPGFVSSMFLNPIRGWTDSKNTLNSLLVSYCTGILRTLYSERNKPCNINLIPVDIAIGNIMLCSWSFLQEKKTSKISIFNLEYSCESILNNMPKDFESIESFCCFKYMLWYPRLNMSRMHFIHLLRSVFFEWIPAIFIDAILKLCRKKPFLKKMHRKIFHELKMLESLSSCKSEFRCDKIKNIYKNLNENELKSYTMHDYDSKVYISNLKYGLSKYFVKQDDETIEKARTRLCILYKVDRAVNAITLIGILKLFLYILANFF